MTMGAPTPYPTRAPASGVRFDTLLVMYENGTGYVGTDDYKTLFLAFAL